MKTIWLKPAEDSVRRISHYIQWEFGRRSKYRFLRDIDHTVMLLRKNPRMGKVESLLADRPSTYRSIVVGSYNKIVYRVLEDYIEIAAFWDTRREPNEQREQTIARNESAES